MCLGCVHAACALCVCVWVFCGAEVWPMPCNSFVYCIVCRDAAAEAARVARSAAYLGALEKQLEVREVDLAAARQDLQEREAAVKQAQDVLAAQQVCKLGTGSWRCACGDYVQSCVCDGNLRHS